MLEAALSPWDVRATQVLIVEAGGAYRARPSRVAGRTDIVFGSPVLVDRIAELAGFE
jgi:fructose-1,6-bisphosphatase/inositol monophosphatase family enzyme